MLYLIVLFVVIAVAVRLVTAPFRFHRRRQWYGYGYNPYAYGCRRRRGWIGGLLPILALVAIDRMFGGRRF